MQIASRQPVWDSARALDGRTMLALRAGPCMTARIAAGRLAPGSRSVTVDWGDGTVETLPGIDGRTHTYAAEREYRVAISDDLSGFGYTAFRADDDGSRDMLREVISVGRKVASITNYGFNNCHNLRGVIELPGVTEIEASAASLPDTVTRDGVAYAWRGSLGANAYVATNVVVSPPAYQLSRVAESNARFRRNGVKVACAAFGWWRPRRYLTISQP